MNRMQYRKKPVVIEAVQLTVENALAWLNDKTLVPFGLHISGTWHPKDQTVWDAWITIETLEGKMRASIDDWIIKGVKGELYPCKPDIFAATYDSVASEAGESNER